MSKTMLKIASIFLSTCLLASQQTQAFTSKTTDLKITTESKVEKLYSGTYADYAKDYPNIFKDEMARIGIYAGYTATMISAAALASAHTYGGNFKSNNGLVGLAFAAALGAAMATKEAIVADHEYEYLSTVTNSDGQKTVLDTHIVANEEMKPEEVEAYGAEVQKKFIAEKGNQ